MSPEVIKGECHTCQDWQHAGECGWFTSGDIQVAFCNVDAYFFDIYFDLFSLFVLLFLISLISFDLF